MAERHGMGLQELEGELRTETGTVTIEIRLVEPTRDERHLAQLVRAATGATDVVRGRHRRSLGRAPTGAVGASPGLLVWRRCRAENVAGFQRPGRSAQQPP